MHKLVLLCAFMVMAGGIFAQGRKTKEKPAPTSPEAPTALRPFLPEKDYAPEKQEKKSRREKEQPITYNARERFYERMEEVAKQRRKNEKLMAKPQYSDPMYFGHKRPPKKRPPEKMKYCKVCGIRH